MMNVLLTVVLVAQPVPETWSLDRHRTVIVDVPVDIRRIVEDVLDYEEAEPIKGLAADLNGDRARDYVLQSADRLCGNGGCVFVVVDGAARKIIGQVLGSRVHLLARRSDGYPDIAVHTSRGAETAVDTMYRFDGRKYVAIPR